MTGEGAGPSASICNFSSKVIYFIFFSRRPHCTVPSISLQGVLRIGRSRKENRRHEFRGGQNGEVTDGLRTPDWLRTHASCDVTKFSCRYSTPPRVHNKKRNDADCALLLARGVTSNHVQDTLLCAGCTTGAGKTKHQKEVRSSKCPKPACTLHCWSLRLCCY